MIFEQYLQEKWAEEYKVRGQMVPDDSDDFDCWLYKLDIDKIIEFADNWNKEEIGKIIK